MTTDSSSSNTNISGEVQAELKRLGKYEIVRKIGAGGMGTVYLAKDQHLNRTVALKVLPKDRAENPILVRRFQSEARASAMLTHDNIVAVYDADQADGYLYIALEFIDGIDLFDWLKKRERIPVKRSIDIIKQVAAALQHAHKKNLVHRDIKPANIMITKSGLVKLADMGLARSIDESLDTTITRDGTTVGTVDYMSPEQAANSKNTDIRSDIYSLGCTWYHMLAGEPPFASGSMTNKLAAHAKNPPPDPREFNNSVTEAIVAIIHRMMAKKKEDRYQTPEELLEDLNNSTNLESNSGNLLAMLLADELEDDESDVQASHDDGEYVLVESEDEIDEDAHDFVVQEERQADLLKKHQVSMAAETNPQMSVSKQRQKKKKTKKEKIPLQAKKKDSTSEQPKSGEITSKKRKPLKRVQSVEELEESSTSINRESKSSKKTPDQIPPKQKVKSNQSRPSKSKPVPKKSKADKPQPQRAKSNKQKPLAPQKKKSGSGLGIDIDWGRAGITIIVVGLALAGIWWGVSKFSGDSLNPDINPYGERENTSSESSSERTVESPPPTIEEKDPDGDPPDAVSPIIQPEIETDDDNIRAPQWIIAGWESPTVDERKTLSVKRGSTQSNSYPTLNEALARVDSKTGSIDLSQLTQTRLSNVKLNLTDRLRIVGNQSNSILTFRSSSDNSEREPWLTVSGGTLELEGLNFIVSNENDHPLEFLSLHGTDLILRNCTFTAIGHNPVKFISVRQQSRLANRLYVENSLFRGENISGLHILQVPCDIYCENTLFASHKNALLGIEQSPESVQQKIHIKNCTLAGGSSTLAIGNFSQKQSASEVSVIVNRSLLISGNKLATTAISLENNETSIGSPEKSPPNISLKLKHTRFVNMNRLTRVKSGSNDSTSISERKQWEEFWSASLPSDDILSEQNLEKFFTAPTKISAKTLDAIVHEIAHPGLGERSLIGINSDSVPELAPEAIEREIAMHRIASLQASSQNIRWREEVVRFDLKEGSNLNKFLASDQCPDRTTVICFGSGLRKISPVIVKNRKLRIQFEQTKGVPLQVALNNDSLNSSFFSVEGGLLEIQNGPFKVSSSRAEKDVAIFLRASKGARILLSHSKVDAPLEARGESELISIAPSQEREVLGVIQIKNSMLNGAGPLIKFNATGQSLRIKNSILLSGNHALRVTGSSQNGILSLKNSSFSSGRSIIDCLGSQKPIETSAIECVFASPVTSQGQSSLVSGASRGSVQQTINWWETACAYSNQISTPVKFSEENHSLTGNFESAWKRFWGQHHVADSLSGPQAVVLLKDISQLKEYAPEDFKLQRTGQAASWSEDGKPIGAATDSVGPQIGKKQSTPTSRPTNANTPSGF